MVPGSRAPLRSGANSGCLLSKLNIVRSKRGVPDAVARLPWQRTQLLSAVCVSCTIPRCSTWHDAHVGVKTWFFWWAGAWWQLRQASSVALFLKPTILMPLTMLLWHEEHCVANTECALATGPLLYGS